MNEKAVNTNANDDVVVVKTLLGRIKADDLSSIKLVGLGGFFGGLLQPAVAQLDKTSGDPTLSNWVIGPLLGVAAAGITVFVLANSNTENKMRLLFFSLLCGLAFPTVLTSAVEGVSAQSQEVADKAGEIATKAVAGNATGAAVDLTKTMLENPTSAVVDRDAEAQLDSTADAVVTKLGDKVATGEGADKAFEQLQQIGAAARTAGYDGTANRVDEELDKIAANAGTVAK